MARFFKTAALAALLSAAVVSSQDVKAPKCSPGSKCPADSPCCSAYGECGVGAFCLGGCDPRSSHTLNSCVPAPACKAGDYKLDDLSDVQDISKYLGDPSKANWQSQGAPVVYNGNLLLTMRPDTVGTLLASTNYVWYGKITTRMTSSQGAGVVTAFIMMSDVKDEIDFEFIGTDIEAVQSNYYSQGVLDYTHSRNLSASNTVETVHTYELDWKPDSITWSIDGAEMRTIKKSDTFNKTSNRYDFPQTPARIMLSLWPAGLPSNGKGTVEWAGGLVDWSSPFMQNGYYYAMVESVSVECYDPPPNAKVNGKTSYVYTKDSGVEGDISVVDKTVILQSLDNDGENPGEPIPSAVSTSKAAQTTKARPQSIPGLTGGGNRGDDPENQDNNGGGGGGNNDNNSDPSGTQSSGGPEQTGGNGGGGGGDNGFSQGGGNNQNGATGVHNNPSTVGGSVFAVLVAVVGLMFL